MLSEGMLQKAHIYSSTGLSINKSEKSRNKLGRFQYISVTPDRILTNKAIEETKFKFQKTIKTYVGIRKQNMGYNARTISIKKSLQITLIMKF